MCVLCGGVCVGCVCACVMGRLICLYMYMDGVVGVGKKGVNVLEGGGEEKPHHYSVCQSNEKY